MYLVIQLALGAVMIGSVILADPSSVWILAVLAVAWALITRIGRGH